MADLDSLPADQRATLGLLLTQGQGYEQIAGLLGIPEAAVRDRAHAALDALGPDVGRRMDPDSRADVADYLLGQQPASEREATRDHLRESPSARAWARGLAGELTPLAAGGLPEIPDEGAVAWRPPPAASDGDRVAPYATRPEAERPASRLGGALLLGGIALIVAVGVILLVSGGNDKHKSTTNAATLARTTPAATSTATTAQQGQTKPIAQINLFSPSGGRRTIGLAQVFAMGNKRALVIAGQGVPPGAYALWLYNSSGSARLLGFVPTRVGSNGRFSTQGQLPTDASKFKQLIVTREPITAKTRAVPKQPGTIVLAGKLP
jgi:Sigma-70, region 4